MTNETPTRAVPAAPRPRTRAATTRLQPAPHAPVGDLHQSPALVPLRPYMAESGPAPTSTEWLIGRVFKDFSYALKQGW